MEEKTSDQAKNSKQQAIGFGERLRLKREELKITHTQAQAVIKISVEMLEALEAEDKKLLVERVYVLGFARSYARFLRLPDDEIVNDAKKLFDKSENDSKMPLPKNQNDTKLNDQLNNQLSSVGISGVLWAIIISILVLIGVSYIVWQQDLLNLAIDEKEATLEISEVNPEVKEELEVVNANAENDAKEVVEDVIIAAEEELKTELKLEPQNIVDEQAETITELKENVQVATFSPNWEFRSTIDDLWLQIQDANRQVVKTVVLKNREEFKIEILPDYRLFVSNAGQLYGKTADKPWKSFGKDDEILRDFPIVELFNTSTE